MDIFQGHVQKPLVGIDWKRYPKELMPKQKSSRNKRKSTTTEPNLSKSRKKVDTEKLLEKLEKAEKTDKDASGSDASDNEGDDNESTKNEEEIEDDVDEEMDEGNDYANNYFDNGEGYLDDDEDNLDEGGIY